MRIIFISSECEFLGIEYLSAVLKQKGHQTQLIFDPKLFATELVSSAILAPIFNYSQIMIKEVCQSKPDLICFSVSSDNLNWSLDLAHKIKKHLSIPIIFGGLHPTISPEHAIAFDCVDFVCVGEGEYALTDLVTALENGNSTTNIPNIWSKQNQKTYKNNPRQLITNLDTIPFPDKEIYLSKYPKFMKGYKIITARGCPYNCTYCAAHLQKEIYKNNNTFFRQRSVSNSIDELLLAKAKYNPKVIRFFDDILTFNKNWFIDFSRQYKEKINLPYFCFIHPQNCDQEIINALQISGCKTVFMGFGCYNENNRKEILHRNYSNQQVKELIAQFKKTKIYLIIDFILGLPAQTTHDAIDIANFFNHNRPDALSGLFIRYYPKTNLTNLATAKHIISNEQLSKINQCDFHDRIIIEKSSYKVFKKILGLILLSKYLPKQVVTILLKIKFFKIIPSLDWNNFFVIIDSLIPKLNNKKRIHTDTISPMQYTHFYFYYVKQKLKTLLTQ